ncbi:C69 family dipeptidase [Sporomusa acidovorans]|uniref:Dipeptidase n=1 Tax=Sporomusa acidovorans (strain ATCC 49682 / DSM 3132 / Mol) TaxID=1123286 RepID=A0ABZ3J195_SPOA4|nr:C69 family dipeptidase [Sporomusa acidovorans]OZC13655.1 dipeptidase [Sporomusa acidovorans DSM 3132]SDE85978.1 Dipeptidase [Sporomusa acidovorans]
MNKHGFKIFLSGVVALAMIFGAFPGISFACTSILVGKNATADGSVLISRNEDYKTYCAKHFIVHPRTERKTETVFKAGANQFTYLLPKLCYKYTATPDANFKEGPMEEAGINEFQVGVSATQSASSNQRAKAADPFDEEHGLTEASIPSVILPVVKTAQEGVEALAKIVEAKGAGEAFGVSIADSNEIWYFEAGSAHHWAAVRVPDDSYMIVANQLRITSVDLSDKKNYMGSKDLISFAIAKGLYNPQTDGAFNFARAYGTDNDHDRVYNYPRVWWGQKMLTPSVHQEPGGNTFPVFMKTDKKLGLQDVMSVLRSHYDGTEYDPYVPGYKPLQGKGFRPISVTRTVESHVIQLRNWLPDQIGGVQWIALGHTALSVYVPFYAGISDTPESYRLGIDVKDDKSAYWTFRTMQTLANTNFTEYAKIVIPEWQKFEQQELQEQKNIDAAALKIYNNDPAKALNS